MISLRAGAMRCDLVPALGGCIAGLWHGDTPVLRSRPAQQLASARQSGCHPLVPYSNRIGHATLEWNGTQHPLVRNNGSEPHAIHGVGWQRPWNVLESDATTAMLCYEHRGDAAWPFAFDCSHTLRLREGALELTLALTNQAAQATPAGLGWHPWFVARPAARLRFEATGRWEMGADKLPTRRVAAAGLDADCATLDLDHCFDGWSGVAQLQDEALHITLRSNLQRIVACTRPARGEVALEPVSHVNNAVQLADAGYPAAELGLRVLAPGETLVAQLAIEVEAA